VTSDFMQIVPLALPGTPTPLTSEAECPRNRRCHDLYDPRVDRRLERVMKERSGKLSPQVPGCNCRGSQIVLIGSQILLVHLAKATSSLPFLSSDARNQIRYVSRGSHLCGANCVKCSYVYGLKRSAARAGSRTDDLAGPVPLDARPAHWHT
jgi:hypothetical protein